MSPPALHLLMKFEDLEGQTINHATFFVCVLFVGRLWLRLSPRWFIWPRPPSRGAAGTSKSSDSAGFTALVTLFGAPCNLNMSSTRLYGLTVR